MLVLRCVLDSDDDDDDDDDDDTPVEPQTAGDEPMLEGEVKPEPDEPSTKKNSKNKLPANELHTYSVPELSKYQKRELVADTEYLDGSLS
jgi:structural maintenance of chromosome 4